MSVAMRHPIEQLFAQRRSWNDVDMADLDTALRRARETLRTAELGLADLAGEDPARRWPGLRNVAVFGRAVTFCLQTARASTPQFDAWYEARVREMRSWPDSQMWVTLRNSIEKEGDHRGHVRTHIASMSTADLTRLPQPPGATGMFIGDEHGGTGWIVEVAPGRTEKFYATFPIDGIDVSLRLDDRPHDDIVEVASDYLRRLRALLDDAGDALHS